MGSFGFKLFGKIIVDHTIGELSVQAPVPTMSKDAIESRKDYSSYNLLKEYEGPTKIKRPSIEAEDAEKVRAVRRGEETPIPCPRCTCLDTRFCYFNNYDVEQPRYFCKACQRFWTNGGSMRNLPVGSGRRKRRRKSGTGVQRVKSVGGSRQNPCSSSFFMAATMILGHGGGVSGVAP